jgi:Fe-S cluster assembly protein SufD
MIMPARIDTKSAQFSDDYAANARDFPGAALSWLDARRRAAMDAFAKTGVPNRRVEAWKYTDLAQALRAGLEPAAPFRGRAFETANLRDPFEGILGARLLLIDGYLYRGVGEAPEAPPGMEILDLAALEGDVPDWVQEHLGTQAAGADQPMGALSLGLMRGGVAIRVAAGEMAMALHLGFLHPSRGVNQISHTRVLLVLEEGASLTLLESHAGQEDEGHVANIGMEIVLKPGAQLDHVRLETGTAQAIRITSLGADIARDARYRGLYADVGAKLSRLDANLRLGAPGAEAVLNGAIARASGGHSDFTIVMDHRAPDTKSRQVFKSVLGAGSRAVTQGRVTVREGAIHSDSHQLFRAVLLDERAEADAKPELEIFADDVTCGHGTAIGALDEDALFYLRARGIPEREARHLLLRAFLEDVLEGLNDPALREALWRHLEAALPKSEDVA